MSAAPSAALAGARVLVTGADGLIGRAAMARLVTGGGVDVIRCHVTAIGGFTPARKLAAAAELAGVRTAWHGPGDASPFAVAANVALEVSSPAFGTHESHIWSDAALEVFPRAPQVAAGWIEPNAIPGWGVGFDECAAARFPAEDCGHDAWAAPVRLVDGSLIAP